MRKAPTLRQALELLIAPAWSASLRGVPETVLYHPPALDRQAPAFAVLGGMCAGLSRLPVIYTVTFVWCDNQVMSLIHSAPFN